jgi:hypothetical protein
VKRKALTLSQSRRRDGRDTRLVLRKSIVCALTLALSSFEPAGAAAPLAGLLPDAAGTRVHLRAVRTVQAASGPISTVTVFDLVRRAPATLVLERTRADGTPNPSVLTVTKDGALALAEDTHGAAADADANDLLEGLNLALAATREADGSTHSWAATLATSPDAGASTASMILIPVGIAGNEFDFKGDAQAAAAPERSRPETGGAGMGGTGRECRRGRLPSRRRFARRRRPRRWWWGNDRCAAHRGSRCERSRHPRHRCRDPLDHAREHAVHQHRQLGVRDLPLDRSRDLEQTRHSASSTLRATLHRHVTRATCEHTFERAEWHVTLEINAASVAAWRPVGYSGAQWT